MRCPSILLPFALGPLVVAACATVPSRPMGDMTVTVELVPNARLAALGARALATGEGDACRIWMPYPTEVSARDLGERFAHEVRHCNGEGHDQRGVWK